MQWQRNMGFRSRRLVVAFTVTAVLMGANACTKQEAVDTLGRTVEGTARGACENAGNCQNTCPDGSIAQGPFYHCR